MRLCRVTPQPTQLKYTAAIASLPAGMLRHGQHVSSMVAAGFEEDASSAEAQANLACCLTACAGGQLASLHIEVTALVVAAWEASLHSLRQLHLGSANELLISSSLHGLTQLTLLILHGRPIRFGEGARLPASVEQLSFSDRSSQTLPDQVHCFAASCFGSQHAPALGVRLGCVLTTSLLYLVAPPQNRFFCALQVAGLSRLSALALQGGRWAPEGYSPLTRLSALARLQLSYIHHLPACLGQLTTLQALVSRAALTLKDVIHCGSLTADYGLRC